MARLRIYRIEDKYVAFLHSRDNKVQHNKGARRPYVGVVLLVGGYKYFVPMESPKPNHSKIKPGRHIMRIENGMYGQLGFNNMVPVPDTALIEYDINTETDMDYRELLKRQISFCNRKKTDIFERASKVYYDVVNKKNDFLVGISCDFKKLEKALREYDPNYIKRK